MNATRLHSTMVARESDRQSLDALVAAVKIVRTACGISHPNSWGPSFKIGAVPMYHVLAAAEFLICRLPLSHHGTHLRSHADFDERNPAHYRLLIFAASSCPPEKYPVPVFFNSGPVSTFSDLRHPANGYFDS